MAKISCSEHKHVTDVFPGETAASLGLKIGLLDQNMRHKLIRALGKIIKDDGVKDFSDGKTMLGILLQALGENLKAIGVTMKGTPAITVPPLIALPTETIENLATKIAALHYEDYPALFNSIKLSLEKANSKKTAQEREYLGYCTKIVDHIRKVCKPHMENGD